MSALREAIDFVENNYPLPRCEHDHALRDHSGEALEPPCGCRAVAEPDLVKRVETLLSTIPAYPWRWVAGRTQQHLHGPNGNFAQVSMPVPKDRAGEPPRDDYRAVADLIENGPDLLRRMVDELKALRAHVANLNHDLEASNKHREEYHEVRTGY